MRRFIYLKRFYLITLLSMVSFFGAFSNSSTAKVYTANTDKDIVELLPNLHPGDTLKIEPGNYSGGVHIENLNGSLIAPIIIEGSDATDLPVFTGGNDGLHFSQCNYVQLRNIKINSASGNGLNLNSESNRENGIFSTNILLENLVIKDIGPIGNHDAIKMGWVQNFVVRNCGVNGWGGSGIDFVGCSNGTVTRCRFFGKKGFSQGNGIQIKGGSHSILVEKCTFQSAGRRCINLGGSTGLEFFRPPVGDFEAKDIEIAGNIFIGGTAVAFVTSQRGYVHHNAILYPSGYVIRILQESQDPRFQPCGNGLFANNIVIVNSSMKNFINIGNKTNPQSFTFSENLWYDTSGSRTPDLPVPEKDPVYNVNPQLTVKKNSIKFLSTDPRLMGKGPEYYKQTKD